jgi:hypothetical protein
VHHDESADHASVHAGWAERRIGRFGFTAAAQRRR